MRRPPIPINPVCQRYISYYDHPMAPPVSGSAPTTSIARRTVPPPARRGLPALIASAGGPAATRFLEFFASAIRNPRSRGAAQRLGHLHEVVPDRVKTNHVAMVACLL